MDLRVQSAVRLVIAPHVNLNAALRIRQALVVLDIHSEERGQRRLSCQVAARVVSTRAIAVGNLTAPEDLAARKRFGNSDELVVH